MKFSLIILIVIIWPPNEAEPSESYIEKLTSDLEAANNDLIELYNRKTNFTWYKDAYFTQQQAEKDSPEEDALDIEILKLKGRIHQEARKLKPSVVKDDELKDKITHLPKLGYDALNENDFKQLEEITNTMSSVYKNVKVCSYTDHENCTLTLIPDIADIIFYSNDINEIEYYWNEWRTKSGQHSKDNFTEFVKLFRKASKLNGYEKPSDYWFRQFGDGDEMIEVLDKLIIDLQPFFKQFHARVRSLLRDKYGSDIIKPNLPYPQHLSEKYIGAAFRNEENDGIELPYGDVGLPNITEALANMNYTPKKLFDLVENFYKSIGLNGLDEDFWTENVLPKGDPSERYLYCSNKPYNYIGINQLQMTYCPNVDFLRYMNMFETVAALHFYKESKVQLPLYQTEPFPDFLESLGKIFSLSASSPTYLEKIGILSKKMFSAKHRLNRLYFKGFQEVFVLPVLYVLDKYRVDVLNVGLKTWDNCAYWNLVEKYTGAMPPIKRSNDEFDIPSKLLVAVDEVYSGTIIGTFMKYQVYKHLCEKTGEYIKGDINYPLDYCDLSNHPEIGEIISNAMALGSSKPWTEILSTLTDGETELSVDGFIEYYQPLLEWLKEDNMLNNEEIGWQESKQCQ